MIRHLARLMWHRRRHNALLVVEIFCAFLVLFSVVLLGVQYANNYRQPIGYDIARAWSIEVSPNEGAPGPQQDPASMDGFRQVMAAVRDLPQVEAVTAAFTSPYSGASWGTNLTVHGRRIGFEVNEVADAFPSVIGVRLIDGRWFDRRDNGSRWRPVVINAKLARDIFGETQVAGRTIPSEREPGVPSGPAAASADAERELRVVGVIEDFRQHGEFSTPEGYMFRRVEFDDPATHAPRLLLIKVAPGTSAEFEETLLGLMAAVAPNWSFDLKTLEALRREKLQEYLAPLLVIGTVAAFLLLMVALGLTGVVWQNVTQRMREIGLRRAKGATRRQVHMQFIAELALLTTAAVVPALAILAQAQFLPLPPELQFISRTVYVAAVVVSVAAIYLLTLGAAWYPSRLSMRVEPAEALRYE